MTRRDWLTGCIIVTPLACLALAGQPRQAESSASPRPAKQAADREEQPNPLFYEGPGIMFETVLGTLVFSPGETVLPETWSFDLNWSKGKIQKAAFEEVELVDVSGWMTVQYSPKDASLKITVVDDSDEAHEFTYKVGPRRKGEVARIDFHAYLRSFFSYMNSEHDAVGTIAQEMCDGGRCSCDSNGCTCEACCPVGSEPFCTCSSTRCVCTCTKGQPQ